MLITTLFFALITKGAVSIPNYLVKRPEFRFPRSVYPVRNNVSVASGSGSQLILTNYIKYGNISEARELAKVSDSPFSDDIPSFSGFFTVNKEFNSNLFFWFFPAEYGQENAPVILWLQGGPGASSLYGLFEEIGPYRLVTQKTKPIDVNPFSWHKNHSLIFIDNPVGTGFSFTEDDKGYATDQTQVGEELYSALIQFFTLFPELQRLPFYIAGESYAGKYIPSIGYAIHVRNPTADIKINLKGLAIGNGLTDPVNSLERSHFLFQLGLIDSYTYEIMKTKETKCKALILSELFMEALDCWYENLELFIQEADYRNGYNLMKESWSDFSEDLRTFLNQPDVRRALHVGDVEFSGSGLDVSLKLRCDIMKSVRPRLEVLMDHYKVLYYSGQMDIILAYAMSVNMFNTLQFSAAEKYHNAKRVPWYVDGELAGYVKSGGNFTEVLVRNAGHMVPADQPKWALNLMNRFTTDTLPRSKPRANFT